MEVRHSCRNDGKDFASSGWEWTPSLVKFSSAAGVDIAYVHSTVVAFLFPFSSSGNIQHIAVPDKCSDETKGIGVEWPWEN